MWRTLDADPIELVEWRKETMDQKSLRDYRFWSFVISVFALLISFAAIVLHYFIP